MNGTDSDSLKIPEYKAPILLFPECRACLLGLARDMVGLTAGQDQELKIEAEETASVIIEAAYGTDLAAPEVANQVFRALVRLTGQADPYADYKIREMARAREAFLKVQSLAGPDLLSRLTLAALGNSLDFFRPPEEVMPGVETIRDRGFHFYRDDSRRLGEHLAKGMNLILYLTDNSGEVYFDLPLYRYLQERAPRVVLVVKGGPGLNDLTRSELELTGLIKEFKEVLDTGTDGAGLDRRRVSPEFLDLLQQADLVIVKGMANFETIYPLPFPSPAFFIFKVKCPPIQRYLNAPPESFWALWRD